MPLSNDPHINQTASDVVDAMRVTFDTPMNCKPSHARGQFAKGTFRPSPAGASLSTAEIFYQPSTPLIVRFSSDTGRIKIPDSDRDAQPRGLAIRFVLSEDGHTHFDIITHTANGFAVRTGEELLAMFEAKLQGTLDQWLERHPHAKRYGENKPRPPESFGTEQWFGVNAYKFIDAQGRETFFRWFLIPEEGTQKCSLEEAARRGQDYLFDDLTARLDAKPPSPLRFKLLAQIPGPGDIINDATQAWSEARQKINMGTVEVDRLWPGDEADSMEQRRIVYDPIPRMISGIGISDDPLLEMRAAAYLISGKKRREADNLAP